jgi:hypothetical protein
MEDRRNHRRRRCAVGIRLSRLDAVAPRIRTTDPVDRLWLRINRLLARAGLPRAPQEGTARLCKAAVGEMATARGPVAGVRGNLCGPCGYGEGPQAAGILALYRIERALERTRLVQQAPALRLADS